LNRNTLSKTKDIDIHSGKQKRKPIKQKFSYSSLVFFLFCPEIITKKMEIPRKIKTYKYIFLINGIVKDEITTNSRYELIKVIEQLEDIEEN